MNVLFRVLAVLAAMVAASTLSAAEDQVDRDIGRAAAAKVVAETLVTDQAYRNFLEIFLSSSEMREYINTEAVTKAASVDKEKAEAAVVAAAKEIIPKPLYVDGMTAALAQEFTYTDLKQILTFIRSDVGKRYLALGQEQHFTDTMLGVMFKGKATPDPRPVLEKELKARFPSMTFKF